MFIDQIHAIDLQYNTKEQLEKVKDSDVLQIFTGSGPIQVLMTQEHYLTLVNKVAAYERQPSETIPHDEVPSPKELADEIKKDFEERLKKTEPIAETKKLLKYNYPTFDEALADLKASGTTDCHECGVEITWSYENNDLPKCRECRGVTNSKELPRTIEQLEKRAAELNANADEWESGALGESEEHAIAVKRED